MRNRTLQAALAIALAALFAGCGQAPVSAPGKSLRSARPLPQRQMPPMMRPAGQPGMAGPAQAEGHFLRGGVIKAMAEAQGFEIELRSYGEGFYKGGERVSALRKSTSRTKLTWVKPNKLRGEILQTDNPMLEGGKLATTDGENITARAAGFLGLFALKMRASDAKMRNIRNHPFKESLPGVLMERLTGPTSTWTVVGDSVIEGTPIKLVSVGGVRRLDNAITEELIGVDPRTFQVRKVTMMAGGKPVIDYTFMRFRWNPRVGAEMFSL